MKRIIPVVAVAGALTLAACGSSSSPKSSSTTAPSSASTAAPSSGGAKVTLQESGSSLMYPYLETVAGPFHTANPSITLAPAAGGSGKGLSDAAAKTTDFGGSDAYLSKTSMGEYPGLVNIPVVVSSQAVDYNLKGISNLKLSGNVLAQIYQGTIAKWNDSAIAALNPGVSLPDETIHPIHRSDSSGDSFLFTSFLSATNSKWSGSIGPSELPTWPSANASGSAQGNPGMVQSCSQTPGCVAYIGISAEASAKAAGLGESELENAAGKFLQSSSATVDAAVSASLSKIPSDLAASLIYASGPDAYPIVNFEYILVLQKQASSSTAAAIRTFLNYVIDPSGGSSPQYLAKNQFQALPSAVLTKVKAAINGIS